MHCKKYFEKAVLHVESSLFTKSQIHDRHSFDWRYLIAQALILLVVYAEHEVELEIQSVEFEFPPSSVSARMRQNTDCPAGGVGALPHGSVIVASLVVSLQYQVAASFELKLLLLHWTK